MAKRDIWIDCGYKILSEKGHEFITVDELSTRMGISRGSFFYHFKNREGFIKAMMDRWLADTESIIAGLDYSGSFEECYDRVTEGILPFEINRELKIRLWGGSEPIVAESIAEVDGKRLDSFRKIFAKLPVNDDMAETFSKFRYGLLIGLKQLNPSMSADEVSFSADLFKDMILKYTKK